jgi:ATP-dependent Clp protease adapter protein ClpS
MSERPLEQVELDVLERPQDEESLDNPWKVVLYNDEEHTFDEVIRQLILALHCDHEKAFSLTLIVHQEGKAMVFEGAFESALRVQSILSEIELITELKG